MSHRRTDATVESALVNFFGQQCGSIPLALLTMPNTVCHITTEKGDFLLVHKEANRFKATNQQTGELVVEINRTNLMIGDTVKDLGKAISLSIISKPNTLLN